MGLQEVISLVETNSFCNLKEVRDTFLKVAHNILNHPDRPEYRILKKANLSVVKKILALKGGREMLLVMGFSEDANNFKFPYGEPYISQLKKISGELCTWEPVPRKSREAIEENPGPSTLTVNPHDDIMVKPIVLESVVQKYSNPFLRRITETFHIAQVYSNRLLKENARDRIPVEMLEKNAQKKMRSIQLQIKKEGKTADVDVSMQELLLVELLNWFKEEFFTWVDCPECEKCGEETVFHHMNTDRELMIYTKRIEMYKCTSCYQFTAFPRYNDLNILLETRKGRCGEWANVFTLLCHAMDWDARYVLDETDHVWTEVWSPFQKRWLHCDPCDNVCDSPLMYEHGWKKKLSYVMAYSPEELQDVTWRYSSNHKELLKRRKLCTEAELIAAILELRGKRWESLTVPRKEYLTKRTVEELVQLMQERHPKDEEMRGRTSGSINWRVARGETTEVEWMPSTFGLYESQLVNLKYGIKYSCALDRYECKGHNSLTIERWYNCVMEMSNMMRKVEHDWKQVYLCRTEGFEGVGRITWKVMLKDTQKRILSVYLKMERKTFENGEVSITLSSDDKTHPEILLPPENYLKTTNFRGAKFIIIEAMLKGGKGKEAWQHAQLFRQSVDSDDYPFELDLTFE
ncbi:hypothetical protein HHI36_001926 [Cryptolaemus montrouzieri]|uniref:Peptide-N(4)-(N-acetyl-beta-glucosaminyl)asparagine amidase n=1 Tax=Cryptolaemus montrouzieri TaxID=559131 RepID=A0ABD2P9F7_9CUCU